MKIFARISWVYATLVIALSLAVMIVTYRFLPRPSSRKLAANMIQKLAFFGVDVSGVEDPSAQIFLMNHQSDLDIALMELISKRDITWVAKKELFEIPFFGLALKLPKDIAVDRESKSSLVKLLRDAKEAVDASRVIAMFPEGTRARDGKMLPFKNGAKMLADSYSLVVQPVVFVATAKHYNAKEMIYHSGKIKAIFLPSFRAQKDDKEWLGRLQKEMQEAYDRELSRDNSSR